MAEEVKLEFPTKPIALWGKMKELRRAHFRHTWQAKENGEVVITGIVEVFLGVLGGMGNFANPTYGPYYTRLMRSPDDLIKVLETVESAGYGHDMCSSMRAHLGQYLTGLALKDPFGRPYKPDLVYQFYLCHSVSKMAQAIGEMFGIPYYILPVPQTDTPVHRAYLKEQLYESIDWLEKTTGRKYDDESFLDATKTEWEAMAQWAKICELNKAIPAPIDVRMMQSLRLPIVVERHKKTTLAFYRELYDEVKQRVEDGISARGFEKARLVLQGMVPFYDPAVMRWPEAFQCVFVAGQGAFGTFGCWDVHDDGTWVPGPTWKELGLPLNTREDGINAQIELYMAHFPLYRNYLLSRRPLQTGKIAEDWHCQGVVAGYDRGCRALGAGARETIRGLQKQSVPFATFEGCMCDPRDFDRDRAMEVLRPFFESMGLKEVTKIDFEAAEEEETPTSH